MKTKKGVTLAMLLVLVTVLSILTTAVVKSVSNSIDNARLTIWTQEISTVQDLMKENKSNSEEYLLESVIFDAKSVASSILTTQFKGETITDNKITLYRINLVKLGLEDTTYGKYETNKDIYVYSKETRRVYYIEGMKFSDKEYYTLTSDLTNKYVDKVETGGTLSTVVFNATSVEYTNAPVKVTVNVPKTYTNIQVTTSNANVSVGAQVTETGKYTYEVNTNNYSTNYVVTVSYNDGAAKSVQYTVDVYDGTSPQISSATRSNDSVTVNATDDNSGIKEIRYITASMPTQNIQEYFRTNGTKILGNTFKVDSSVTNVVVYVEDNAGNYTTRVI